VLAANVIDARQGGTGVSVSECDAQDYVTAQRPNSKRLAELQEILARGGQWQTHRTHGQMTLLAVSERLRELRKQQMETHLRQLEQREQTLDQISNAETMEAWRNETRDVLVAASNDPFARTSEDQEQDPAVVEPAGSPQQAIATEKKQWASLLDKQLSVQRRALADTAGYLGALKLTFATTGIFSEEKRWFWQKDKFYVRQDVAEATYGTDFASHVADVRGGWFTPRRLIVSVPEPDLLAIDRHATIRVTNISKGFTAKGDVEGKSVETAMRADLTEALDRIRPQAVRFAKALLKAQVHELAGGNDVAEVEVRFTKDELRSALPGPDHKIDN
jgi:hypothetical protein